jgi:hypothetical protein
MTEIYRTGTGLYGQASGEFSLRIFGDLPLLTVVDYGHYRGHSRLSHGGPSRGAGTETAEKEDVNPQDGQRSLQRAVGFRQWRIDTARWTRIQETGSPNLQKTFMHRVSVIVHCVAFIHCNCSAQ